METRSPRRTFLDLVEPGVLPEEVTAAIQRFKIRGSSGKVNLALSELPRFSCLPGPGPHLRGAFSISPSVEYLERAYDDAKYGEFSRHPYLDVVIPSMIDPEMAPPGRHVLSVFVQYAPYQLKGGWTDARREAFGDAVVNTLTRYAPNLRSAILGRQVITPAPITTASWRFKSPTANPTPSQRSPFTVHCSPFPLEYFDRRQPP